MATARVRMFRIHDGPGLLEMQFSDYNPQGHIVEFTVEETDGTGQHHTMHCQVTGSDRIERITKDACGHELSSRARLIRVRSGMWPLEGWYDPHTRKGLLKEAQGYRNGVPPRTR